MGGLRYETSTSSSWLPLCFLLAGCGLLYGQEVGWLANSVKTGRSFECGLHGLNSVARVKMGKRGTAIGFSAGEYIIIGADDGVYAWRWRHANELRRVVAVDGWKAISFAPDRRQFAILAYRLSVPVYDTATMKLSETYLRGRPGGAYGGEPFHCGAFSPDGRYLVAGTARGEIVIWQRASKRDREGHEALIIKSPGDEHEDTRVRQAVVSVTFLDDTRIFVCRPYGWAEMWKIDKQQDGQVQLVEVGGVELGPYIDVDSSRTRIAFSSGSLRTGAGQIGVYDRRLRLSFTTESQVRYEYDKFKFFWMGLMPTETRAVWLETPLADWKSHCPATYSVTFVDGQHVAAGGADGTITLWHLQSIGRGGNRTTAEAGQTPAILPWMPWLFGLPVVGIMEESRSYSSNGLVVGLAVSPNGKFLASITTDGVAEVWKIE
ncbi:MAG: hypothetical protein KatS3mg109_2290 [Pirellulaceae bacterium]|nr:MAG: hypothetical protein KatS3mg109_2290 [Pirellulaceae bacterium]